MADVDFQKREKTFSQIQKLADEKKRKIDENIISRVVIGC